ncbi:polyketide synthase protein [Rutstroemia sp. NJR-2017a WRK4]|nr:polyketide synthase protein [Rutstroemia sp. NJR-2017a WRK4]
MYHLGPKTACGFLKFAHQYRYLLTSIFDDRCQLRGKEYISGHTCSLHNRIQPGLTAISIDLGIMTSVGRIANDAFVTKHFIYSDHLLSLGAHELFILPCHYCKASIPITCATESQLVVGLVKAKPGATSPSLLIRLYSSTCVPSYQIGRASKNHIDAGAIVTKALIHKLSSTQDTIRSIDAQKTVFSCGIDSIIAVELRIWFGREFKAIVPTAEIMLGATFFSIGILVAQRSMRRSGRCRFLRSEKCCHCAE